MSENNERYRGTQSAMDSSPCPNINDPASKTCLQKSTKASKGQIVKSREQDFSLTLWGGALYLDPTGDVVQTPTISSRCRSRHTRDIAAPPPNSIFWPRPRPINQYRVAYISISHLPSTLVPALLTSIRHINYTTAYYITWLYLFFVFLLGHLVGCICRPQINENVMLCYVIQCCRTATGEAWQMIMMDCARSEAMCDPDSDTPNESCGTWFSYLFFISFYILCSFMVSLFHGLSCSMHSKRKQNTLFNVCFFSPQITCCAVAATQC